MDTPLHKELVGPCWICKKMHERQNVEDYKYFNGILVCSNHPGVKEWYGGALEMGRVKFEYEVSEMFEGKEDV